MADTRDLIVRIKGDTKDFNRSMKGVSGDSNSAHVSFLKLAGAVAAGQAIFAGAAFAIRKVGGFLEDSVKQYEDAEASQKELANAVLNVTHGTQAQLKATNDLADSLSKKGVLDDDVIRKGLAQLSTFGLTNKSVQKLAKSMADLTVNQFGVRASGDQAVTAANIMAKALNGNFGALEKMGIHLTTAQKQMIKFGNETQRVNTINQVMAANLRTNQATALETTAGKMAHLSVMFGNAKESIGGFVIDAVTPMVNKLAAFVSSDRFQEWLQRIGVFMQNDVKPAFQWILNVGIPTLLKWGGEMYQVAVKVFNFLKPSLDALFGTISKDLVPALEHLWNKVLKPLAPIIGTVLVLAVWVLINALRLAIKVISEVINILSSLIGWVIRTGKAVVSWFSDIPTHIKNAFKGLWNIITAPFRAAFNGVADLWNNTIGKLKWKVPKWIPGLGGHEIGAPQIPKLAMGGIVDSPTLAMIGEGSSPEAVIPLDKLPQIIAQSAPAASAAPNLHIEVNVGMYAGMPVEKRQIALEIYKELVRAARAQGVKLPMIGAVGVQ